jgi:hypothetical protein
MTGPEDFLRDLDDPAGPPSRLPTLEDVVGRGRQLRARRNTAIGASAAAVAGIVGLAAFGVVPGVSAARTGDTVVPATQPPTTTSATATTGGRAGAGGQVLAVAPAAHAPRPRVVTPSPSTVPIVDPCTSPAPAVVDPSATAEPTAGPTETGPAETGATTVCAAPSPTASSDPGVTTSPSPTDSASPSESAAASE